METKCETPYCRNIVPSGDGRFCSKCRTRKYKENSPFRYYYNKLKYRAKERGKEFNLCLEQFMLIWLCEPRKWEAKLRDTESKWQMDRIRNEEGYHFDNIQLIRKQRNIRKYVTHDRFVIEARWRPAPKEPTINERAPF